jgi:histidinol-phosphate aminotransferase
MPVVLSEPLNRVRQPFNVNSLAQVAAVAALGDDAYLKKTIGLIHAELDFMVASLNHRGIEYIPSQANFLLIHVGADANDVFDKLLHHGIIVRSMTSYGYPEYIRVSVGRHAENERFLEAIGKILR